MSRSPSGNAVLRDGDGVLGTHSHSGRSCCSGRDGDVEIGSGNLLLSDSDEVLGTHTPTSMA